MPNCTSQGMSGCSCGMAWRTRTAMAAMAIRFAKKDATPRLIKPRTSPSDAVSFHGRNAVNAVQRRAEERQLVAGAQFADEVLRLREGVLRRHHVDAGVGAAGRRKVRGQRRGRGPTGRGDASAGLHLVRVHVTRGPLRAEGRMGARRAGRAGRSLCTSSTLLIAVASWGATSPGAAWPACAARRAGDRTWDAERRRAADGYRWSARARQDEGRRSALAAPARQPARRARCHPGTTCR